MPLVVPTLDDRNYADILRDALARIPVHNPEWTNFNDSDPGVTMIQLFAFMTESIMYRANQIPERNRLKFLKMLGIPLRPAAAATGFVTLRNERGPLEVRTFSSGLDVRTGQVRFRTTQGLDVLPVEARIFYKEPLANPQTDVEKERNQLYTDLYADLLGETKTAPAFYQVTPAPQPGGDGELPVLDLAATVDNCLWIALLARPLDVSASLTGDARTQALNHVREQIAGKTLTVGVMPYLSDEGIQVEAGQISRAETRVPLFWEIASVDDTNAASYEPLESRADLSVLATPGLVELTLPDKDKIATWDWSTLEPGLEGTGNYPPSLADANISNRVLTWLRLRIGKSSADDSVKAKIGWLGINATMVEQRANVTGELVGTGTGEPDQRFTLANTPVLPDSLALTVGAETWYPVDDLLSADPEVQIRDPRLPLYRSEAAISPGAESRTKVYTLDPESGQICFGDGAHGTRPKPGARIVASYAYGGGRQGNVGIGLVNKGPDVPASYKVNNPLRTWGGDDTEAVAEAEKTIPRTVQHRDRLVSQQDFEDITLRTPGVDLGRVEIVPLYNPVTADSDAAGVVTVLVIPASAAYDNPKPDQFFLETVCDHLQPRRLITTELYVRGPDYVDVWVSVGMKVLGGYATGSVREAVKTAIYRFLSPLYGGHSETGWPLQVNVSERELEAVVARVEGVQQVEGLLLAEGTTDNVTEATIAGLQLPRLRGIAVTDGVPLPLSDLRTAPDVEPPEGADQWTPIPVIPERC